MYVREYVNGETRAVVTVACGRLKTSELGCLTATAPSHSL